MTIINDIKKQWLLKLNVLFLGIIVFLLPINQKIIAPFIGMWGITSLLSIFVYKLKFKLKTPLISLIGFYLILVLGLLWTDNMDSGIFDLEVKLSLIIFPVFFLFLDYSRALLKFIIWSFLLGIIVGFIQLMWYAIPHYNETQSIEVFFYVYFSDQIHPSYFSYYVTIALGVLCVDLTFDNLKLFRYKIPYILLIVFLFIFNILLLSKVGIIASCLLLLFFITRWAFVKRKFIQGIGSVLLIVGLLMFSYNESKYVQQRTTEFIASFEAGEGQKSSTAIRLDIWQNAKTIIIEKPLIGHGTGDVKDVLVESYVETNMQKAANQKLNAHNQYLQVLISAGIIGFLPFVMSLIMSLFNGVKKSNYYLAAFVLLTLLFLFPESMLENQAGTIAFGLFFGLLNQNKLSNEST